MSDGALRSALTTDFCPWANRYVYWLKEPIGWFVMALGISVLVGLHISPMGWVLAAALLGIIVVGMAWPWIAIKAASCRLHPTISEIHESDSCDLVFTVRNCLPLPLWGLAIEGYLDREGDDVKPTVALACVPPVSEADYRLAVNPEIRGQYPVVLPTIACAFPFGIWTARRKVSHYEPLLVYPAVSLIQDESSFVGTRMADCGDGLRSGQTGELLGVRPFRNGDRLRNVHWIHTARTGQLVVSERGAPQQQTIEVVLDPGTLRCDVANRDANRNVIAWRVRVAASLVTHLHARHVPVTLRLNERLIAGSGGTVGLRRMLRELALLPVDGHPTDEGQQSSDAWRLPKSGSCIVLRVASDHDINFLVVEDSRGASMKIDLQRNIPSQLLRFWREVGHARYAA